MDNENKEFDVNVQDNTTLDIQNEENNATENVVENNNIEESNVHNEQNGIDTDGIDPSVINNQNVENNNDVNMNNNTSNSSVTNNKFDPEFIKNRDKKIKIALWIYGGVVMLGAILINVFTGAAAITSTLNNANSNKLVCKSKEGNITIRFNDEKLLSYTASGMTYNLDEQQALASQEGVEAYIKEFNTWFENNTTGKCTINDKSVDEFFKNSSSSKSDSKVLEGTMEVGEDGFGYTVVPDDWTRFYDTGEPGEAKLLQYSYGNLFIFTMANYNGLKNDAKTVALNAYKNSKDDTSVSNVELFQVKIGKNKYDGYSIKKYFVADNVWLYTYWFNTKDGEIHYLALEGPKELDDKKLDDFMFIIDNYSLTK